MGATSVGSLAFFAGGTSGGGSGTQGTAWDTVDIYDALTGTWSTATLSVSRADVAALSVGGKALFAGGGIGIPGPPGATTPFDTVDIYDSSTGTWSAATLSAPRTVSASTAVGSKAFFAGGVVAGVASGLVDVYDAASDTWSTTTLPGFPFTATTVGTRALFATGSTVEVYDDATGSWSSLPVAAGTRGATSLGTKAFFVGGTSIDIYDDATGAWSSHVVSLTNFEDAASVGTKAFFLDAGTVDIFDDATGAWSRILQPRVAQNRTVTTVAGRVLVAGGRYPCGLTCWLDVVDIYDDNLGASYCSPAVLNSTGSPARIRALGFPGTAAQGYALLQAEQLPAHAFGYFLNSPVQGVMVGAGGSQGTLCLSLPIGRYSTSVFDSGAVGAAQLRLDLANTPTPAGAVAIQAGQTWNFQAWYRDANPGPTSNFTDAVSVVFQ